MALLGSAALAMWWDIAADVRADFEDWHAHEHFPERLSLPGFLRGTRWRSASGGEGMFVMYELADHATLSSPQYLARLNSPTPWSTRLMPQHRNMVRSQCRVVASSGGGVAANALTVRLAAVAGGEAELQIHLGELVGDLAGRPGLTGAHLLRHDAPAIAATREQAIRRNADGAADWIVVVCGYQASVLEALAACELAAERLSAHGAAPGLLAGRYGVACSAVRGDTE